VCVKIVPLFISIKINFAFFTHAAAGSAAVAATVVERVKMMFLRQKKGGWDGWVDANELEKENVRILS
jgi:hypothetical protein